MVTGRIKIGDVWFECEFIRPTISLLDEPAYINGPFIMPKYKWNDIKVKIK